MQSHVLLRLSAFLLLYCGTLNATIISPTISSSIFLKKEIGDRFTLGKISLSSNIVNPNPPIVSNSSPVCGDGIQSVTLAAFGNTPTDIVKWYDASFTFIGTGITLTINNVTTSNAGNYYATIENNLGEISELSAPTTIIVEEIPANNAYAGEDQILCAGETTTSFSAALPSVGTGFWTADAANPAGAVVVNPNLHNTLITNLATGTYIFRWTLSSGTCGVYDFDEMTITVVDILPSPSYFGDTNVCLGGLLFLQGNNAPPEASYHWTGPNGFTSVGQNVYIEPVNINHTGNYTVTYIMPSGCESLPTTQAISVFSFGDAPSIVVEGGAICMGDSIKLSSSTGGVFYQWIGPDGASTGTLSNPVLTTVADSTAISFGDDAYDAGLWRVRVTDMNGCIAESEMVEVVIHSIPNTPLIIAPNHICEGEEFQLNVPSVAGANYNWYQTSGDDDILISQEQNPMVSGVLTNNSTAEYCLKLEMNGCYSTLAPDLSTLQQECVGLENSGVLNIPFSGANNVKFTNIGGSLWQLDFTHVAGATTANQIETIWNDTIQKGGTLQYQKPFSAGGGTIKVVLIKDANWISFSKSGNNYSIQFLYISDEEVLGYLKYFVICPQFLLLNHPTPNFDGTEYTTYANRVIFQKIEKIYSHLGTDPLACATVSVVQSPIINPTTNGGLCGNDLEFFSNLDSTTISHTFEWAGPNGFISDLENPIINSPDAGSEGSYQVTVTDSLGCSSLGVTQVGVISNVFLSIPTATNGGDKCFGEAVQLFGGEVAGASYRWYDGDPVASPTSTLFSTNKNPVLYGVPVGTHFYFLKIEKNGCESNEVAMTEVNVKAIPQINLSGNTEVFCEGQNIYLDAPTITNGQYFWTGPNGFQSFEEDPIINAASLSNSGSYILQVNVAGCNSNMTSTQVTISPQPATPIVENNGPFCTGADIQLFGSTQTNGQNIEYLWSSSNGFISSFQNPIIPTVATANSGSYQLVVTVDGCPSLMSVPTIVEVLEEISAPNIFNNSTATNSICQGETIFLTTDFAAGANYYWTGPNGFNSTFQNPILSEASMLDAGAYFLTIEKNGCLSEISLSTTVYISQIPEPPIAINSGETCEGSTVNLMISTPNPNAIYTWIQATTNLVIGTGTTLELTNITMNQAGAYYAIANVGGCESTSSIPTQVIVNVSPNQNAFAGNDFYVCGSESAFLDALVPATGGGEWTSLGSANISNPSLPNTEISDLQMGENMFVWTLSNGNCEGYSSDTLVITVNETAADIAQAGVDKSYCEATEITLLATNPAQATGVWTQPNTQQSLGVNIVTPTAQNSLVTGIVAGNVYIFYWSLSSGICENYSTDEVLITINQMSQDVAYAGEDNYHCGESPYVISATSPLQGNGSWSTNSDALIITAGAATTQVINLGEGENIFYWTLDNLGCEHLSMDSVIITNLASPIAIEDIDTVLFNAVLENMNLVANDDYANNDIEITIISHPENGTIEVLDDGQINYTPDSDFVGIETFEYQICNRYCPEECDQAEGKIYVLRKEKITKDDCFIPSIITPNGDGDNDAFVIPCLSNYKQSKLIIFNRWGDEVYKNDDYKNDWEGTHKGYPLAEGSYYFMLYINNNPENVSSGYVIIRP